MNTIFQPTVFSIKYYQDILFKILTLSTKFAAQNFVTESVLYEDNLASLHWGKCGLESGVQLSTYR